MKRIRMTMWGILIVLSIVSAGCTGTVVKFAAMPDQPIDASRGREITASACGFQFYLFFPIMINDRAERAYAELVKRANGDVLTDIKVNERWIYALIGTGYCTDMRATAYPINTTPLAQAAAEAKK